MTEPIDDRKKSEDRGPGGRFALGNKASPGRPPGRGPVAEMRVKLETDLDKIIDTLRTQALAGDMQAIRIILDRVQPTLRPVEVPTTLALPANGTLAELADALGAAHPHHLPALVQGVASHVPTQLPRDTHDADLHLDLLCVHLYVCVFVGPMARSAESPYESAWTGAPCVSTGTRPGPSS